MSKPDTGKLILQVEEMKKFWKLIKQTFTEWSEDKAPRLAAALSYYTIFSIPPLLVIIIAIAGLAFGQDQVRQVLLGQMEDLLGSEASAGIESMLQGAQRSDAGIIASVVGVVVLLLGASGVFGQLQEALNTIWDVKPRPGMGIMGMIRKRFFSFTMVLGVGFLLLVSLVVTALLGVLGDALLGFFPGFEQIVQIFNFVVSFLVITLLFALTFKFVPDAEVAWKDVWLGAAATSLLFSIGKMAIGLYLGNSDFGTTFGAAASVIIILLWVYYSAQILFVGAEFTQVYANLYGSKIVPDKDAVRLTEEERAQQGIPTRTPELAGAASSGEPIVSQGRVGVFMKVRPQLPPPQAPPNARRLLQAGLPALLAFGVGIVGSLFIVQGQRRIIESARSEDCP
jgi:membrane protein